MHRKKIIAANWKMHELPVGSCTKDSPFRSRTDMDVIVFPSSLHMQTTIAHGLITGGQYGRAEHHGAFTGDVSMSMLSHAKATAVLCGHSERRTHHHETDDDIAAQYAAAIDARLLPILCIGETANERSAGKATEVVERQLHTVISAQQSHLTAQSCVIAYEPVWAIGTGNTAQPSDIQAMHAHIRSILPEHLRSGMRIIYGGSIKSANAHDIFSLPDVDGGLVGASSLDATEFAGIVEAASSAG